MRDSAGLPVDKQQAAKLPPAKPPQRVIPESETPSAVLACAIFVLIVVIGTIVFLTEIHK